MVRFAVAVTALLFATSTDASGVRGNDVDTRDLRKSVRILLVALYCTCILLYSWKESSTVAYCLAYAYALSFSIIVVLFTVLR
jgi:hypothetical protein